MQDLHTHAWWSACFYALEQPNKCICGYKTDRMPRLRAHFDTCAPMLHHSLLRLIQDSQFEMIRAMKYTGFEHIDKILEAAKGAISGAKIQSPAEKFRSPSIDTRSAGDTAGPSSHTQA